MVSEADLEFLKNMDAEAKRLANSLKSRNHWAKPFFSDAHLFKPGVPRVFLGINGAGDEYSNQIDIEDGNEQKIWSGNKPYHNSYLDERWGSKRKGSLGERGQSFLQLIIQRVFEVMYGPHWEQILRTTPCFNLIPVSSHGTTDPKLQRIWIDGVKWGIQLLEYLRPELIILSGNGENQSPWSALKGRFGLIESRQPIRLENRTFSVKEARIQSGPLKGARVVGCPSYPVIKGLPR